MGHDTWRTRVYANRRSRYRKTNFAVGETEVAGRGAKVDPYFFFFLIAFFVLVFN